MVHIHSLPLERIIHAQNIEAVPAVLTTKNPHFVESSNETSHHPITCPTLSSNSPRDRLPGVMDVHYTWCAPLCTTEKSVASPTFSGRWRGRLLEWYLRMYPRGIDSSSEGFVSLRIYLKTVDIPKVDVYMKLCCINASGLPENVRKSISDFPKDEGWGWTKFLSRDDVLVKEFGLHNGFLKIHCCLTDKPQDTSCVDVELMQFTQGTYSVLWRLYEEKKFSDFAIIVGDKEFRAHKAVVAARSEVFAAMLEHDLAENATNTVQIEDFEPEVVEEMVRFMYLDDLQEAGDVDFADLLSCADKYNLRKLKLLCAKRLVKDLSVDSVVKTLLVAHLHNLDFLKAGTIGFFADHWEELRKGEGWKEVSGHADLVGAIFDELKARSGI